MLKGVTILNSYDVTNPEWYGTFFPAIVFSFVAISGIALIVYIFRNSKQRKDAFVPSFIVSIFTLLGIFVSIHGFTHLPENKYHTRYEVTVSDEVNFNEFNSKYEVVEQNGLIYTIIEKTD